MTPSVAILLAVLIPLLGALMIALSDGKPDQRESVTLVTAGLLFLTVLTLVPVVFEGGRPELTLLEMFPGLPIYFKVEPLGMLFGLVGSGLWIVNSIYSIGYMRGNQEGHQTRFSDRTAPNSRRTGGISVDSSSRSSCDFLSALRMKDIAVGPRLTRPAGGE